MMHVQSEPCSDTGHKVSVRDESLRQIAAAQIGRFFAYKRGAAGTPGPS